MNPISDLGPVENNRQTKTPATRAGASQAQSLPLSGNFESCVTFFGQ